MNIINIRPIHCLHQLPVYTVVKFILSVAEDQHCLLRPLGSLNVLNVAGDGACGEVRVTYEQDIVCRGISGHVG